MGPGLVKFFVSFEPLISQERLAAVKRETNELEEGGADARGRVCNLDPGIITHYSVILATTKGYAHRIYLGEGIYAEPALLFRRGSVDALPWSYPDYQTPAAHDFFRAVAAPPDGQRRRGEPLPDARDRRLISVGAGFTPSPATNSPTPRPRLNCRPRPRSRHHHRRRRRPAAAAGGDHHAADGGAALALEVLRRLGVPVLLADDQLRDRETDEVGRQQRERALHADDDDREHRPERDQEDVEEPPHPRGQHADHREQPDDAEDERAEQDPHRPGDVRLVEVPEAAALGRRRRGRRPSLAAASAGPRPSSTARIAATPASMPPS